MNRYLYPVFKRTPLPEPKFKVGDKVMPANAPIPAVPRRLMCYPGYVVAVDITEDKFSYSVRWQEGNIQGSWREWSLKECLTDAYGQLPNE